MPQAPFSRLPTTPTTSDIYDKLQAVGANAEQSATTLTGAQSKLQESHTALQSSVSSIQKQISTPQPSIPAFREVNQSTVLTASDETVDINSKTSGVNCGLPTTQPPAGQTFTIKNAKSSTHNVTMRAPGGVTFGQTIDGAAVNTFVLAAGGCIVIKSDGTSYLLISRI